MLYSIFTMRLEPYDNQAHQADRTSIPKFASFRPIEPAAPPDERKGTSRHGPHEDESPGRTKHRRRHRSKGGDQWRHRDARKLSVSPDLSASSLVHAEAQANGFVVDRNGDTKILSFGTLDQYAIPVYLRFGGGNVLGASPGLSIDKAVSNEKGIVLSPQGATGFHEKNPLRFASGGCSPELKVKKEAISEELSGRARDFIPLGFVLAPKRKGGDERASLGPPSSEDEHTRYRSIPGNPSLTENLKDPDLELACETSLNERKQPGAFKHQFQQKKAELAQRVNSDPSNAEVWLQFIHYQNESLGPQPTVAEQKSTADIKMSMYETALQRVKSSEGRQLLLLEMMEEAPKTWNSQKLSAQWTTILKSNPNVLGLWNLFLDSKQTAFSDFSCEGIRNAMLDCINVLQKYSMQAASNTSEQNMIYQNQVFIFLRMTLYTRESGFLENALAAWQARLEFEFFLPPGIQLHAVQSQNSGEQEKISRFEHFWESEVPRIGEDGAESWFTFCESEGKLPDSKIMTADHAVSCDDSFSTWIAQERHNMLLWRRPARITDDMAGNDPYRVVLFSDIRPILSTSPSLEGRYELLEAFLIFCQLPPYQANHTGRIWYKDGFLKNEALISDCEDLFPGHADVPSDQDVGQPALQLDLPQHLMFGSLNLSCQSDTEILFAKQGSWFSAFGYWQSKKSTSKFLVEPMWVLKVLKSLLVSEIGGDHLAEYVLALELSLSPGHVRKTARSLLKQRRSSLRLYNAYALIEYRLSNASKGEDTLIAAINMSKGLENVAGRDCILLWRTWIWELLEEGKSREAFARLQAYADAVVEPMLPHRSGGLPPNPAQTLRTENRFKAFRDHMLTLHSPEHAVCAMECLVLLAYLEDTTILSAAMAALTANLALLSVSSTITTSSEESLRQSFAHLLCYHAIHTHLFRPSEMRSFLSQSIARFPENTIFLSLYAWNESRFRMDERVRFIVQDVVLGANKISPKGQESVVSHLFVIHTELTRSVTRGSNDHAIRASFERAVESKSGAHCAGIWKMYFCFEHSRGNLKNATAVWYRGIRACPWVKELYLLPFEYLRHGPGAMRDADLKKVYDMMVEKGLRLHVDLEQLIGQREE